MTGTGIFVSAVGHVLTNSHVVEGFDWVQVSLEGEAPHLARVVARDHQNDLALLETDRRLTALPIFRRDVEVGEEVATYGFPLLDFLGKSGKFTVGTVNANNVKENTSLLQIQAPVQPGNSGGPLFDRTGNVVGIVVAGLDALELAMVTRDIPQLVNFAIKSDIALSFLSSNRVKASTTTGVSTRRSWPEITSDARSFTALIECNAELALSDALHPVQVEQQDDVETLQRLRRAAEDGSAAAQFNLGVMYASGDSVPQDEVEAVKWFCRAADQGIAAAQCRLGALYLVGDGVAQDDAEAVKWLRRAAEQDDEDAQSLLGGMYAEGRGVLQDLSSAYMWLSLSAAAGVQDAQRALDLVARQMTPQQIAEAKEVVCEWEAKTMGQRPMLERRSWPGASEQVIKAIDRILGAVAERFDGLSLTNTKNYFTVHFVGEGSRTRTDWCFHPKGGFFVTDIRQPRSPVWDNRLDNIQGLELLEYNTGNGGGYRLKVSSTCGEEAISAIVDLASETLSRKAHLLSGKKEAATARGSVLKERGNVPDEEADTHKRGGREDHRDNDAQSAHAISAAERNNHIRILGLLVERGGLSRSRIKQELGISDETYDELCAELIAKGLVEETESGGLKLTSGVAPSKEVGSFGPSHTVEGDHGAAKPREEAETVKACRRLAEEGDAHAQYTLGVMYAEGDGDRKSVV